MSSASVAENFVAPATPAPLLVPLRNVSYPDADCRQPGIGGIDLVGTGIRDAHRGDGVASLLARLRSAKNFTTVMVLLNLISGIGVFWYYKLNGPAALRFAFDYNYFLYFLVFHVTFSFSPKPRPLAATEMQAAKI